MLQTKTYTEQINFWHWGQLFALSNLMDSARHYCLELIKKGQSKLQCNKALQGQFKLNKRWANSIYTEVAALISNVKENRANQIKVLSGQISSIKSDIKRRSKQIKDFATSQKKTKIITLKPREKISIKKACNLKAKQRKTTQIRDAKFGLHQKKRRLYLLEKKLYHLSSSPLNYVLPPKHSFLLVGSKDESSGNQIAQFNYLEDLDELALSIRTPLALESNLGEKIRIEGLKFNYGKNEIIQSISSRCYKVKTLDGSPKWGVGYSAVSLRFYFKDNSWYVAVTTDVKQPEITSLYLSGYVGIDLNADSMGWAVCDSQGNLLEFGDYILDLHSKSSNQREAILAGAARKVVLKAKEYNFPIASEELDFQKKKTQLKEKGKKSARMLSSFAYSAFNEALDNACIKHGVAHKKINPAYSSLIGMTKFMSMYGMNSSSSAAFVIARRGRRFSERLPNKHHLLPSRSAYPNRKHVWSHWSKVCKNVLGIPRHQYFTARLNRTQKVTSFCQLTCSVGKPRQVDNPIPLELFEVGEIPTGNDTVAVAVSKSINL